MTKPLEGDMLLPGNGHTWIAGGDAMLFLVVSTPRPERPSDIARTRQSFWPWMAQYQQNGVCRQIYARVGRGAIAILDVESNEALHRIVNTPPPERRWLQITA